jgi:hypothetical protein
MKRLLNLTLALLLVITLVGTVGVTRSLAEEENPYLGLWEITGQQNGDQYASLADAGRKAYMDFLPSGAIYGVMSADGQHIKTYMGYKVTGENTLDIYEGEEGIPAVYDPATGIITVTAEDNYLTFVERVKEDPLPDIRALVDNADEERTYYGYKMTQDGQEIDMVTMLPAMGMDPEDFYLTLNPDGTGYVQFGSEDAGGEITWTDTTLTAEGESITYTREGDYLLLSIDGTTGVTFAPEGEVEALMAMNGIEIAEPVSAVDVDAEALVGDWKLSKATAMGQTLTAEQLQAQGLEMSFTFNGDGTAVMTSNGSPTDGLSWTVEDGKLSLSVSSYDLFTFTYDGEYLILSMGGDLYFEKVN